SCLEPREVLIGRDLVELDNHPRLAISYQSLFRSSNSCREFRSQLTEAVAPSHPLTEAELRRQHQQPHQDSASAPGCTSLLVALLCFFLRPMTAHDSFPSGRVLPARPDTLQAPHQR